MTEEKNHRSPTGAIVLIVLGVLFLLNNFGVFPWSVWGVLWRFWPVFLILLGLRLILGKGKNHEAFAIISFLVLLFVFLISIATVNPSMRSWMQSHMSWFPINQMMPQNQMPFRMYNRRYRMFDNGNGSSNDFNNFNNDNSAPSY